MHEEAGVPLSRMDLCGGRPFAGPAAARYLPRARQGRLRPRGTALPRNRWADLVLPLRRQRGFRFRGQDRRGFRRARHGRTRAVPPQDARSGGELETDHGCFPRKLPCHPPACADDRAVLQGRRNQRRHDRTACPQRGGPARGNGRGRSGGHGRTAPRGDLCLSAAARRAGHPQPGLHQCHGDDAAGA